MLPRWILPGTSGASQKAAKACQGKRFLSLFGGAAQIAKSFAQEGGEAAVIDFADGPANDLSKLSNWNRVLVYKLL